MDISVYVVVDVLTVLFSVTLAFMSLTNKGYKVRINRFYAVMSVALSLWLLFNHIGNSLSSPKEMAIFANYFVFGCSLIVSVLGLKILAILGGVKFFDKNRIYDFIAGLAIIVSFTPFVGEDITRQEYINGVVFGPLGDVHGLSLIVNSIFTLVTIVIGLKKANNVRHKQLVFIGYSMLFSLPIIALFAYVLPVVTGNFYFTEFGSTPMFIIIVATYFAVIRHQLFDIKQATMRTVGYVLTVAVIAGLYIGIAYGASLIFFKGQIVDGVSFSPLNITLALLMALVFQPVKHFFDRITNRLFYHGEYDRDVFFKEFGQILSHDTDLKLLLRQSGEYIETNLKADKVFFYLFSRGAYSARRTKLTISQVEILEIAKFYKNLRLDHEALLVELIENETVKTICTNYHISIVLPLLAKKQIVGFLFLGEHKSRGYSRRDLLTLESIINELAIAIQNSLSVEEVRELNATLQERINEATHELRVKNQQLRQLDEVKDEFLSIASHQLRTPLTSIKGYVNMIIEGDFGKISSQQREILNDVFVSSERMVQLVNDFLDVSRIQTGKFAIGLQETDLTVMVQKEIELMTSQLELHQLKIDWQFDDNIPVVKIDADKIRQVVMNMIDNAIYYSKADTTIKVALRYYEDQVIFTVTDTGIGVPVKEQANLFGKFFRASNARKRRPDGTGVGLYLAKKIVDAHGGAIIFKSVEGKGSTFGFRLPMAK